MDSCILEGGARRIASAIGDDALPARLLLMEDTEPDAFLVIPEDSSSWTIICIASDQKGIEPSFDTCNDLANGIPNAQIMNAIKKDKIFTLNEDGELVTLSGTPVDFIKIHPIPNPSPTAEAFFFPVRQRDVSPK